MARIRLEEVAQATQAEMIDEFEAEYRPTIEEFDEIIVAFQKGGEVDGDAIVKADDEDLLSEIERLDGVHEGFQQAAEVVLASQRR